MAATATTTATANVAASSCGSLGVKENESGNWVSGTVCMAFVAVCVPCDVSLYVCVCVLLWVSGLPLALSFFFALLSLCAAAFVVNNDSDLLTRLASTCLSLPRLGLVWFGLTCLLLVASLPHILVC